MLTNEQEIIVIEKLPELLNSESKESAEVILKKTGFCEEHTEEIMELITSANARFSLYKTGMKSNQFSGCFDENRIFNETLNLLKRDKSSLKNRLLRILGLK